LRVAEIRHDGKQWRCSARTERTFRNEAVPVYLVVDIPKETDSKSNAYIAVLEYENVYGSTYQKEILFTLEDNNSNPDVQELRKARRIKDGQA
jgi:hypothetical protein